MFYAIDFDTRSVESKSTDGELLAAYVLDNDLTLAVAIVDSVDELVLQFDLQEMTDLYENLTMERVEFKSEKDASEYCWLALNDTQDDIPNYSVTLGKKLVKNANSKRDSGKTAKAPAKKQKRSAESQGASRNRIKLDYDSELIVVEGKCKQGSILHTIVTAIDDEMCSTIKEVIDYITSNHIIPKTGELADVKFAEHNIKYFVKKGNLSIEEGL